MIAAATTEMAQVIVLVKTYLQTCTAETVVADADQKQHPVDVTQIGTLLEQLATQLKFFDSDAVCTMQELQQQING